jgi:probable F420-dependent oxidoreductase
MQTSVVDAARQALGPIGACLPVSFSTTPHAAAQREAVTRLEHAAYGAVWTNEVIGKDALVQVAMLLAATERIAFGTAVDNIWARQPHTAHGAAAQLAQAYPGRVALGLGVGYPEQAASTGQEFGNPLATMRDYLDRMDSPTWPPAPGAAYPRIIAANGPKMLALAGEIAHGALPAMVPPEFTAQARQLLGPDELLVVGLSVAPNSDRDRAKATARDTVSGWLGRRSHAATMVRLGYSARDITEVSDRLVNAVVAHGNPADIGVKVREHLVAGADHVALLLPVGDDFATGVDQLEQVALAYPV